MKKITHYAFVILFLCLYACTDDTDSLANLLEVENFTVTIDENPANAQIIGSIAVSTGSGALEFTIKSQSNAGAFAVNSTSGELTVSDSSIFDFEVNPKISGVIAVSNGSESVDIDVIINLNDIVEIPSFTIWTGAKMTFTKADGADPTQMVNQDRITDNVWITRGNNGGQIFNIKTEVLASSSASPVDTEWAIGTTASIGSLTFQPFRAALGGQPKNQVGIDLVVHLITDDIYIDIKILQWSDGRLGGFSYSRATE